MMAHKSERKEERTFSLTKREDRERERKVIEHGSWQFKNFLFSRLLNTIIHHINAMHEAAQVTSNCPFFLFWREHTQIVSRSSKDKTIDVRVEKQSSLLALMMLILLMMILRRVSSLSFFVIESIIRLFRSSLMMMIYSLFFIVDRRVTCMRQIELVYLHQDFSQDRRATCQYLQSLSNLIQTSLHFFH